MTSARLRVRDVAVAAAGFVFVLAVELLACVLAPRPAPPAADCVLDRRAR